ncbi:hypothetical protein V1522DRAFT_410412 [Lipomyces starkeyi]
MKPRETAKLYTATFRPALEIVHAEVAKKLHHQPKEKRICTTRNRYRPPCWYQIEIGVQYKTFILAGEFSHLYLP